MTCLKPLEFYSRFQEQNSHQYHLPKFIPMTYQATILDLVGFRQDVALMP